MHGEIGLKVWVGHYAGNKNEWFVVGAKNKGEAFLQIDPIVAEPNMDSLKELHAPGFVNFSVELRKEDKDLGIIPHFLPPKEDVESGYWLVFGGALGEDDEVNEYILKVVSKGKTKKR
jgi:hypothetical protein